MMVQNVRHSTEAQASKVTFILVGSAFIGAVAKLSLTPLLLTFFFLSVVQLTFAQIKMLSAAA